MLRNGVWKVPDHGARLGIAKRMAAVALHENADHAARRVGLPILALSRSFFRVGEFIPPAQFFKQHMVKLGVAGGDVGAQ